MGLRVRALEQPESPRWNLSFDFDGTLHHPDDDPPVSSAFFEKIAALRANHGALWGINTGRSMNHVIEGLIESRFPFAPDWVVARECEIWFPNAVGRWVGDEDWNRTCEKEHRKFFRRTRKLMKAIRAAVEEHTGATWVEQHGEPAGLISRTEDEMDWIVRQVTALAADEPLLGWQRNTVYLRFGHRNYQKGSSLVRAGERFALGPAESFAIGDSHNDFEMLSPEAAGRFACPANAVPEIRAHVQALGGYVCRENQSLGCVEALGHFFDEA